MSIKHLKNLLNKFENLLFVNYSCMYCGKEIFENKDFSLCENCCKNLDIINMPVCKKCGEPLGKSLHCESCYYSKYEFLKNISFCHYTDVASKIIRDFKYDGKRFYAKYIANMLMKFKDEFTDINFITFVPATASSNLERGYNQSEEIAKEFSALINIPVVSLLGKQDGFKNQASLSKSERLKNLVNAFFVLDESKHLIKGKNILIIDDVFTTGTTLSRCAETIKKFKPNFIKTLTFAKTKFQQII